MEELPIIKYIWNVLEENITLIAVFVICGAIIITMYNRIKYLCLKKASEKVADVEELTFLTGSEKFALVVKWIDEELPAVFRNSVVYTLIESLVDLAYRNAKKYMSNYVKRKTGYDIDEIIEILNKIDKDKLPDSKETK